MTMAKAISIRNMSDRLGQWEAEDQMYVKTSTYAVLNCANILPLE